MMIGKFGAAFLCIAAATSAARAETFVIRAEATGHEAIVKIPAAAVMKLSANSAESLVVATDPQFESMRLSGDVSICIAGSTQPIQIKADNLVLELTPDSTRDPPKSGRADAAANKFSRSTTMLPGDDNSQVFVGNVVFDLQTLAGPMQIKADRVEHQLKREESAREAGA
ncbi:MAG: hypothetical protein JWN43_273 [Gammaproteobacteria bacterium]|nr:hypothetical protein [Gammaproteobacteria bacterium]